MRDYLDAIRQRIVVFDGGMGATLEQFDLTQADYGGLAGKCHEALVLHRPDVIEGVHAAMLDAGRGELADADAVVEAEDPTTLIEVLHGHRPLAPALQAGAIHFSGDKRKAKRFTQLFPLPAAAV